MANLTLRTGRDSALTFEEMDNNFLALDSDSPFKVSDGHIAYDGKVGIGPGADSTYHPTHHLDFGYGDSNQEATIGTHSADLVVRPGIGSKLKVMADTEVYANLYANRIQGKTLTDSSDLTISQGNIYNVDRLTVNDVEFRTLYDRDNGVRVRVLEADSLSGASDAVPTSEVIKSALDGNDSAITAALDSAVSEIHQQIDSVEAYSSSQFTTIYGALDSQQQVDRFNLENLGLRLDSLGNLTSDIIDSEHAWNVAEHAQLQANIDSVNAELIAQGTARHDSEHAFNVAEHAQLQSNLDSSVTVINGKFDSVNGNLNLLQNNIDSVNTSLHTNVNILQNSLDSHVTVINGKFDSVNNNLNQLQININNLDSDVFVRLDSLEESVVANLGDDLDSAVANLNAAIDSEHAWNVAEHEYLVDKIDSLSLDNLTDVQLTTPAQNEVLQWNGSVWSNQEIGIVGTVNFRGAVDATVDAAPASPVNGDFYVNTASGTALASWVGLSTVDSGDGLAWDSDATNWRNLGATNSASVVRVQAGTAISVDETDAARPVVAVRKDITDTWYYTQDSVDEISSNLQSNIDSVNASLDSHVAVINGQLDSVNSNLNQLQININNLDSNVNGKLDSLQTYVDQIVSINIGDLDSDLSTLQNYVDSFVAAEIAKLDSALDSEHAWNVAEHQYLDSTLRLAIDSVAANISAGLEISSTAPIDPDSGQLWLDLDDEQVYIYDGDVWFEFPGTADQYASLAIGDEAPANPVQGTMWMSSTDDQVKIYDGDVWFGWPYPGTPAAEGLDSEHVQDMIDSTIDATPRYTFDSAPVQGMIDSELSNPLTIANALTIDATGGATFSGNVYCRNIDLAAGFATFHRDGGSGSGGVSGQISLSKSDFFNINKPITVTGNGIFSGNVGIGTDSPAAPLEVNGSIRTTPQSGATLRLFDATAENHRLELSHQTTKAVFKTTQSSGAASGFEFQIGSSLTPLTIDATGNVGIGRSDPQTNLHVQSASDTEVRVNSQSSSESAVQFSNTDRAWRAGVISGGNWRVRDVTSATDRLTINTAGNATFSGTVNGLTLASTGIRRDGFSGLFFTTDAITPLAKTGETSSTSGYDLGTSGRTFKDAYFSGTVDAGGFTINGAPISGGGMEYDVNQAFSITTEPFFGTPPPALVVTQGNTTAPTPNSSPVVINAVYPGLQLECNNGSSTYDKSCWTFGSGTYGRYYLVGGSSPTGIANDIDLGGSYMYSANNWFRNVRINGAYTGTTSFVSRSFQNGAPVIDARELISVLSELRDANNDVSVTSVEDLKEAMRGKLDTLVSRLTSQLDSSREVDEDAWAYTTMSSDSYDDFMLAKYGDSA